MSDFVQTNPPPQVQRLSRAGSVALIVGAIGLAVCALGWLAGGAGAGYGRSEFYRAYLFAFLFWLGVSLGSMGIVMLHHLTGGAWGLLVRRIGEAAAMTLPLMLVLFLPILAGMHHLYPWADHDQVARDAVLRHRERWLNPALFTVRSLIYFVVWIALAFLLARGSLRLDRGPSPNLARRMRKLSAGGLVIYFVTMTLASIDWVMSRETHWFSSIFGFIVIIAQALAGLAFMIHVLWHLADAPPFSEMAEPNHFNDLGNMLLMLVILWAYLSFAQWLVTYMGNTQEEITWYVNRTRGGWDKLALALIVLHFFVPFFLLLSRQSKRRIGFLGMLAGMLFAVHILDDFWRIVPSNRPPLHEIWYWTWLDLAAPVGIGGVWVAAFLFLLRRNPLMPLGEADPIHPAETDGNIVTAGATPSGQVQPHGT